MTDPMQAIGSLVLWTGLIVGGLLMVRRWAQRSGRPAAGHSTVRVVARTPLTRGSAAVVLEADGRRFLIGAAEQRVTLLSELDPVPVTEPPGGPGTGAVRPAHPHAGAVQPGDVRGLPPHLNLAVASATERRTTTDRPWIGLLDRARALTVRTHVDRPTRAPGS